MAKLIWERFVKHRLAFLLVDYFDFFVCTLAARWCDSVMVGRVA